MKKIIHPAQSRGKADFGWLKARYSFSFANYFDPERVQFGALRVLNDDTVASGMGFGRHPHENMEIVTIPQRGSLKHRDSLGNEGTIISGEIQVMSAGSGVEHSEMNANRDTPLELFQIWIIPETENVQPRYDQKTIKEIILPNKLNTVVFPKNEAKEGDLWIHQQSYFNLGEFTEKNFIEYNHHRKNHGSYIFVIKGSVIIDNEIFNERDAIGIWETDGIRMSAEKNTQILLIEIPMS